MAGRYKTRYLLSTIIASTIMVQADRVWADETTVAYSSRLSGAEKLFHQGDYEQSLAEAQALEDVDNGLTPSEKQRLYLLRARLGFAFGDESALRDWLRRLHNVAPDAKLDPLVDPPLAFSIWSELSANQASKAATDARTSGEPQNKSRYRFWLSLLPFGIGHFDQERFSQGISYLGGELAVLYASNELALRDRRDAERSLIKDSDDPSSSSSMAGALGTFGFLGLWGHEVAGVLPATENYDPSTARIVRRVLCFFPFGVGQRLNGDYSKAVWLSALEGTTLIFAAGTGQGWLRDQSSLLFYLAVVYGAADGWINFKTADNPSEGKRSSFNIGVSPVALNSGVGIETHVGYQF